MVDIDRTKTIKAHFEEEAEGCPASLINYINLPKDIGSVNMGIRDAYEQFFQLLPKETFFNFGINNIITIDNGNVYYQWKELLRKINNFDDNLYVRDFGRNGNENNNVKKLYKEVFNIDIKFDPTNNAKPKQLLQTFTEYEVNKTIFNYQISHIFGNTKNVYCFTAPWNIVFIPKMIDPLTGHEAKGDYVKEFQILFKKYIFQKFNREIMEYNEIINKLYPKIELWVDKNILEKKKESYLKEFKEIKI